MKTVKNEVEWANKSEAAPFNCGDGTFFEKGRQKVADIENGLKALKSDFEALVTSYGESASEKRRG